jgi:trans-aconitate methyltransferase
MKANPTQVWKADEYHKLSIAQDSAAKDFLKQLQIEKNASILDVGCGNGKISARLADFAEDGHVLGIDKSREMIAFARENFPKDDHENLSFRIQDAQKLSLKGKFDMVFSSFALQWIENKNLFFQKAYKALKKEGTLAIVVPTGVSPELEQAVQTLIHLRKWQEYFLGFHPGWFFSDGKSIKHLIIENTFKIEHSHTSIQEVAFPSKEAFARYVLLWFPYLRPLPQDLRDEFFSEVLEEYFRLLPVQSNDSVLLRIPRIDIIATKLSST